MISGIAALVYVILYVFGILESIGPDRGGLLVLALIVEGWLELSILEGFMNYRIACKYIAKKKGKKS